MMSFGSLVRSATLPKSFIAMFKNVFRNIPQTVIFKYEDDLPEVPSNVVVRKWLPQRDMIGERWNNSYIINLVSFLLCVFKITPLFYSHYETSTVIFISQVQLAYTNL